MGQFEILIKLMQGAVLSEAMTAKRARKALMGLIAEACGRF